MVQKRGNRINNMEIQKTVVKKKTKSLFLPQSSKLKISL